ncbi:transposable element Tcb2 transposase [Trichonephila clavipes]|uniref:Transposable element Tcb2 transposase n=1 Tax=Trichonephila clavipes TaxID=2585209 RepID=A0A8X6RP10_TRICX|nr:transposable element Tcb2 transposase [Trichonephila clavipes]
MNRRSPYSKPRDAFMCGERPKKHLLLNASCRLLSMEVGPLWRKLTTQRVKTAHYVNILGDQVHPFVPTSFPVECPLYQDNNAPIHTAKIVQEWFAEHEGEIGHPDWPSHSPDLNIIKCLREYLESKLRARFPPPSTISALETALHGEWLRIPLQVVLDLYASIPRRMQSITYCGRSCHSHAVNSPVFGTAADLPSASRHALLAKDLVTWQAMVGRHILEDIVGRVAQYVDEHYPVDKWHLGNLIA